MNTDLRQRVEELERRVAELESVFGFDEHLSNAEVADRALDAEKEFNDALGD